MIEARPGSLFTAIVITATAGMEDEITYELFNDLAVSILVPSNDGVSETSPGIYQVTLTAPATAGSYSIQWDDQDGGLAVEEITVLSAQPWAPSVAYMGALMRARTRENDLSEAGTFTAETRPTAAEVSTMVGQAIDAHIACTGDWLPEELWGASKSVLALYAAMLIEAGYWPEQMQADHSPYQAYKDLWEIQKPVLCGLASPYAPPEVADSSGDEGVPLFNFGDVPEGGIPEYDPVTQTVRYRTPSTEGFLTSWWST